MGVITPQPGFCYSFLSVFSSFKRLSLCVPEAGRSPRSDSPASLAAPLLDIPVVRRCAPRVLLRSRLNWRVWLRHSEKDSHARWGWRYFGDSILLGPPGPATDVDNGTLHEPQHAIRKRPRRVGICMGMTPCSPHLQLFPALACIRYFCHGPNPVGFCSPVESGLRLSEGSRWRFCRSAASNATALESHGGCRSAVPSGLPLFLFK